MNKLCPVGVSKVRYLYPSGDHTWEIDVFSGELEGLVLGVGRFGGQRDRLGGGRRVGGGVEAVGQSRLHQAEARDA